MNQPKKIYICLDGEDCLFHLEPRPDRVGPYVIGKELYSDLRERIKELEQENEELRIWIDDRSYNADEAAKQIGEALDEL